MKIIKKSETIEFKNSSKCIAYEYPIDDKDINGAVIEISGRYPDEGRVTNKVCKELVYVIDGSGKLVIEDKKILLNPGDQVLIETNEKYYFDGKFTLFTPCTPAWYPEQHIHTK